MPTPDISPYIDLTFFDKDAQDVFDTALVDLQSKIPDWTPRAGNVEVLLLEAMSLQVADAIFAINRLPGGVVMALLKMYGIFPDPGAPPTTSITFQLSDDLGHSIPKGTTVRLDLEGGLPPIVFTTDAELIVQPGFDFGTIPATGNRFTAEGNGVPAGTRLAVIDSIYFVNDAELALIVDSGLDPETDEEWLDRGAQRFARLTDTLVIPRHFRLAALEVPAVKRANAIDNWDSVGPNTSTDGGHITVAVHGDGAPLTTQAKADLEASLEARSAVNLATHVIDANLASFDVTATIVAAQGYTEAAAIAAGEAALRAYFSYDTWDWRNALGRNEIIGVLGRPVEIAYVETLTVPAANLDFSGTGEAGTVLVTVDTIAITVVS